MRNMIASSFRLTGLLTKAGSMGTCTSSKQKSEKIKFLLSLNFNKFLKLHEVQFSELFKLELNYC
jgi:hypothetical protein